MLFPAVALSVPAFLVMELMGGQAPGVVPYWQLGGFHHPHRLAALPYKCAAPIESMPWFDSLLAALAFVVPAYFTLKGDEILDVGWEYDAPDHAKYLAFLLWAMVLKRRDVLAVTRSSVLFSRFHLPNLLACGPGFLEGEPIDAAVTIGFHMFGTESILGIPMNAFANLVVGFLVFGVALQYTGGGADNQPKSLLRSGKRRGGPAKVAIFASGLMGSMSGSVITNVLQRA